MAINPKSLYAPEALLLKADCLQAQEKTGEAVRTLRRILIDYPESRLVQKVKRRLKTLKP